MGLFTDSTWEQFIPFFSFIGMFIIMSVIDYAYLQIGIDSKKVMRKKLFAATPAGTAFSIWGLIFFGLTLFTLMNCFNEFAGTFDPLWISVTFLLMVGWGATFALEWFFPSSLCLIASVLSCYQVILAIPKEHKFMDLGSGYTMGVFMGWLITAALLNTFIFIQQRGLGGEENEVANYFFIILVFLSHVSIVLLIRWQTLQMCWPITLVLLWSVHWVLWEKDGIANKDNTWMYLIGYVFAGLVLLTTILRAWLEKDFFDIDVDIDI